LHARIGDALLLHGAKTSRMLQHAAAGNPVSVAMTLLDGIVLARSVFHHSMNYRSVVIHGTGRLLESEAEKLAALEAFAEHIARGRWADARTPTRKELKATSVISIPIELAAAKIRTGPPMDDEEDYALPIWAGVLPLSLRPGTAIPDPRLDGKLAIPGYVKRYTRTRS
jgi:nitroimidazol reductase NimA-like FMN-containing flavoprotein (pyridoxamine 5'-phosphate oxidase superfamily)